MLFDNIQLLYLETFHALIYGFILNFMCFLLTPNQNSTLMKRKLLLLSSFLVFTFFSQAQTLLTENFSDTLMPPDGWVIDAHADNWTARLSANAGGVAPEARFYYGPSFNATSRLISPEIVTTGITDLTLSFRHFLDDFNGVGYNLQVQTRAQGGPWNIAWTVSPTGNIGPEMKVIHINTNDVGSSTFQFAIVFTGNSYNLDNWYIDDIELAVSMDLDVAMSAITIPRFSMGDSPVTGILINKGLQELQSVDINYQIDEGDVTVEPLSGLGLALGETAEFSFTEPLALEPGTYMIRMWVSNANGMGDDDDPGNDTLLLDLYVASTSVERRPMFEEFTSSTCSPCANFNSTVFNPFIEEHGPEITLVKYQMSWPSPGDPYYTEEGGERRMYYGVSFVPDLYTDGYQTTTDEPGVIEAFAGSLTNPAFMDLSAYHVMDGTEITVHLDIVPYISVQVTAYIAVFEYMTVMNTGNNGETEFHHVMMKMIPDAFGTTLTLVDGEMSSIEGSADMSLTFTEEMDDLGVAVFVQDPVSKQIFQSAYSVESMVGFKDDNTMAKVSVYPNPSGGVLHLTGLQETVNISIYNVHGQLAGKMNAFSGNVLDLNYLPAGYYILRVQGEKAGIEKAISIVK